MSLGIVQCGKCGRKYVGAACPFCGGTARVRGLHPAEHIEGECGYCAPAVAAVAGETPLEVWERVVREKPAQARVFGPPAWLVAERVAPDAKPEVRAKAVEALRREYGLDEPVVPKNVPNGDNSEANVPNAQEGLCEDCGKRQAVAGRKLCDGCRKAAYRGRKVS
jgi:hypothetical protein